MSKSNEAERLEQMKNKINTLELSVMNKAKGWECEFAKKCVEFIRRDMCKKDYLSSANHKADNLFMEIVVESLHSGETIEVLAGRNSWKIALYHTMGADRITEVEKLLKISRQ